MRFLGYLFNIEGRSKRSGDRQSDLRKTVMPNLNRITFNPEVMGGKPCIRGIRITVGTLVGLIASGMTVEEILADYPYLEHEDIMQALAYAAWRAEERELNIA